MVGKVAGKYALQLELSHAQGIHISNALLGLLDDSVGVILSACEVQGTYHFLYNNRNTTQKQLQQ